MSKKSTPKRRRKMLPFSYGQLEARQLLAATGFPQFDGDTSIQVNVVANGNFDANVAVVGQDNMFDAADVPGWDVADSNAKINLLRFVDNPRESVLDLDSTAAQFDHVTQNVATDSQAIYVLAFDLRGRFVGATPDDTTNDVSVSWDGTEIGTYRGIHFWQTIALQVTAAAGDSTLLEFKEVLAGSDGAGPLIDNVRLAKVANVQIDNAGFESPVDLDAGNIVDSSSVSGWKTYGATGDQKIDVRTSGASEGGQFVNLDSSDTRLDRMYRDIQTQPGGRYFLTFDLMAGNGVNSESEEIRLRWNNDWAGTYRGDADWQTFGMVLTADSDVTRLVLREPPLGDNDAGDGNGPLLDNVRIMSIDNVVAVDAGAVTEFNFDEGSGPQPIAADIQITSTTSLGNARVVLAPSADLDFETLAVDVTGTSIAQNYDPSTGRLQLIGIASVEDYTKVLRTLTYENVSEDPSSGQRSVDITVSSADGEFDTVDLLISMNPINDPPTLATIPDQTATVGQLKQVVTTASDPEQDTLTYSVTASGDAIQSGDNEPIINSDGLISWNPSRAGVIDVTVDVNDGQLSRQQSFRITATLSQPIEIGEVQITSGNPLPDFTQTSDAAIGLQAPEFTAQSFNGLTHEFAADGTTGRIYAFLAHWCPHCQAEVPVVVDWLAATPLPSNVDLVAVATATNSSAGNYPPSAWLQTEGYTGTAVVDDSATTLLSHFGGTAFPFWVAVDANGTVVDRATGEMTVPQLNELVTKVTPPAI